MICQEVQDNPKYKMFCLVFAPCIAFSITENVQTMYTSFTFKENLVLVVGTTVSMYALAVLLWFDFTVQLFHHQIRPAPK